MCLCASHCSALSPCWNGRLPYWHGIFTLYLSVRTLGGGFSPIVPTVLTKKKNLLTNHVQTNEEIVGKEFSSIHHVHGLQILFIYPLFKFTNFDVSHQTKRYVTFKTEKKSKSPVCENKSNTRHKPWNKTFKDGILLSRNQKRDILPLSLAWMVCANNTPTLLYYILLVYTSHKPTFVPESFTIYNKYRIWH